LFASNSPPKGHCTVFKRKDNGGGVINDEDRQIIGQLSSGNCFGEISIVSESLRTCTVEAKSYVELEKLNKEHVDLLCMEQDDLKIVLDTLAGEHLARDKERMEKIEEEAEEGGGEEEEGEGGWARGWRKTVARKTIGKKAEKRGSLEIAASLAAEMAAQLVAGERGSGRVLEDEKLEELRQSRSGERAGDGGGGSD
jgi:CRP-like cAMP-binding protein